MGSSTSFVVSSKRQLISAAEGSVIPKRTDMDMTVKRTDLLNWFFMGRRHKTAAGIITKNEDSLIRYVSRAIILQPFRFIELYLVEHVGLPELFVFFAVFNVYGYDHAVFKIADAVFNVFYVVHVDYYSS